MGLLYQKIGLISSEEEDQGWNKIKQGLVELEEHSAITHHEDGQLRAQLSEIKLLMENKRFKTIIEVSQPEYLILYEKYNVKK
jgi:hypothetical protein